MHADGISLRDFWGFTWRNRHQLMRFLRWADTMENRVNHDN